MNQINLTKDVIKKLSDLCEDTNSTQSFNVDYSVQLFKKRGSIQEKNGQKFLSVIISDGENSFNALLIISDRIPEEGDILRLINISYLANNKKTVIVKKFTIIDNFAPIGKPIPIEKNFINKFVENENPMIIDDSKYDNTNFTPLSQLTTYTKDIHILVKITKIFPVKHINKHNNEIKLFSFNFVDVDGTEMQGTGFNKGIEKHFNNLKEGYVFEIHGGYLKINDKKFSTVKSDYKLIIDDNTDIRKSEKEFENSLTFNFVKFSDLPDKQPYSIIDVICYVYESNPTSIINTKMGNQTNMRKLICVDDTEIKIEVTLWRDFTDESITHGDIIAFKSVKVGEYGGRSLSTIDSTVMKINPSLPDAEILKTTCSELVERTIPFKPIQSIMSGNVVSVIENNNTLFLRDILNDFEKGDDRTVSSRVKGTILSLRHEDKNYYTGCEYCKKKINKEGDKWICLNCSKEFDNPNYFYTLSLKVKDSSVETYIDFFGPVAEKLLNISCNEYKDLIISKDETKLKEISSKIEFKNFYFIIKPKRSNYNNVVKTRISCFKTFEIDKTTEMKSLIKKLNSTIYKK